ncbi:hypothetical protein KL918_001431 [Ogataea parapolymorpha]|nr:hypothetical protein KL918_001431 [Ogataea parapolymorpha]KAG7870575.1 hypothetical protein KL916_004917 [Ogataea parapolymorpha]
MAAIVCREPSSQKFRLDSPAKNNVQQQTPVIAIWKLTKYAYVEDPLGDTPVSTTMQDTVNIIKLQKKVSISFLPTAVYLNRTLYMIIRVTMSEDMCINDVPIWNINVLEISTVRA